MSCSPTYGKGCETLRDIGSTHDPCNQLHPSNSYDHLSQISSFVKNMLQMISELMNLCYLLFVPTMLPTLFLPQAGGQPTGQREQLSLGVWVQVPRGPHQQVSHFIFFPPPK